MIPKKTRISRKDFNFILTNSRFFHSPHFLLRVAKSEDLKTHFGVSVSKKVSKKAVIRNKIRRRTYSVLRKYLNLANSKTFLFIAKPKSENIKGVELEKEIDKLIEAAS